MKLSFDIWILPRGLFGLFLIGLWDGFVTQSWQPYNNNFRRHTFQERYMYGYHGYSCLNIKDRNGHMLIRLNK